MRTLGIFHNDIPKCEFSLKWSKESPPERLMHRIDLTEGTANSKKHFLISVDPLYDPSDPTLANSRHNSEPQTAVEPTHQSQSRLNGKVTAYKQYKSY